MQKLGYVCQIKRRNKYDQLYELEKMRYKEQMDMYSERGFYDGQDESKSHEPSLEERQIIEREVQPENNPKSSSESKKAGKRNKSRSSQRKLLKNTKAAKNSKKAKSCNNE